MTLGVPLLALTWGLLVLGASLACGEDDVEPTATAGSPAPTHTREAPTAAIVTRAPATPRSTGVAELDSLIEIVESNDLARVQSLIELQTLACTDELGAGGPPKCRENEPEGMEVSVFAFSVCEPEWLREEQIRPNLEAAFSYTFRRYAAYEEDGQYVAIFEAEEMPIVGAAVAITLDGGRIVKISRICGAGEGGEGLIPRGRTEFLLDPP